MHIWSPGYCRITAVLEGLQRQSRTGGLQASLSEEKCIFFQASCKESWKKSHELPAARAGLCCPSLVSDSHQPATGMSFSVRPKTRVFAL